MTDQPTFAPRNVTTFNESRRGILLDSKARIAVVGAGAFGGWTALWLLRAGYHVTLLDAWGPGNSRASSGDETRVIRSTYGSNETYFDLNVRALELWKTHQQQWNKNLFYHSGVLWFCYEDAPEMIEATQPFMKKHGLAYQYFTPKEAAKKYPHIHVADLHHLVLDPNGGYLKARESCQAVMAAFVQEGGHYLNATAMPNPIEKARLASIALSDGTHFSADAFVFACGSWLGRLFPEILGQIITCTKQEAYYLGVPASFTKLFDEMPAWIDLDGQDFYYGIPGNAYRGFKVGVDRRGEPFDPTDSERLPNAAVLAKARAFMAHRFPVLQNAPLIENRVCPYEKFSRWKFSLRHASRSR
ncbi:MAG: FAD-dependent oxidoreductase [Spirosomataceae bacterium]